MDKEQRVVELMSVCLMTEKSSERVWSRSITGDNGIVKGRVDLATRIFTAQMIALAEGSAYFRNLKRVFALILVGQVCHAANDDPAGRTKILDDVFRTTQWGKELVDEFLGCETRDAKFANACMRAKNAWWGSMDKFTGDLWKYWTWSVYSRKFFEKVDTTLAENACVGWLKWGVKPEKGQSLETIAQHSVLAQFYAVVMDSVYSYGIDLDEAIFECGIHHLPDAVLGAHSVFISERPNSGYEEVPSSLIEYLYAKSDIWDSYNDWVECSERVSLFANRCGKAATDLVAKFYDSKSLVEFDPELKIYDYPEATNDPTLREIAKECASFDEMFIRYSLEKNDYDEAFTAVAYQLLYHARFY